MSKERERRIESYGDAHARLLDALKESTHTTGSLCALLPELDRTTVLQHLRVLEDAAHAVALERRQQFEGKARAALLDGLIDDVYDIHGVQILCGMSFFTSSTSSPRRRA